ncbi:tripartite tricarboxylate transporter substrate binding protein [Roseomonas sp. NAR14]|uniref:Tripartite tricarboxylate transporter substrate binding protein n=1 Tax=Roseomonas acroporae TaxID=2937791 RepID=A0A9X1Y5L2_9PROT|nr:tripartite tricarboxylate transporter substrate binding protein [Roseomonas acroporae]MCK8784389.1 tripartite tricarboxylate transporter substrate binding protein [Roseomonas acroporae]
MPTRRRLLAAAPLLAFPALAPRLARAGQAADRPIRYVVPYPPGATNDNTARLMSRALGERLGRSVIVENRAGAAGVLGARLVAQAAPDGETLLNVSGAIFVVAPHLNQAGFDPLRDFAPVAFTGNAYSVVAVNPAVPAHDVAGLLALARRSPGSLNYGSSGIGSSGHLRGALLAEQAGAEMVHVPFPGSAAAVNSVLSGDTQLIVDPAAMPLIRDGRLRGLAVVGPERWAALPDLPTLDEQGIGRDWPDGGWFAVFAPAGTPRDTVARLNAAYNEALAEPAIAERLRGLGLRPTPLPPGAVADRLAADFAATGAALRRLRLTA